MKRYVSNRKHKNAGWGRIARVRLELKLAVVFVLVVLVDAPVMAGVIVLGSSFGTAEANTSNGYGDRSTSQSNSFGLPGSANASGDGGPTSKGNSSSSAAASFNLSTDPLTGIVTIRSSGSSSASATDFQNRGYSARGLGNLGASIQLTSGYQYKLTTSVAASSVTFSSHSSVDFNGLGGSTMRGSYSTDDSGLLGAGTYSFSADAFSSATVRYFLPVSDSSTASFDSTLTLTPVSSVSSVPEPTSMFLVGSGVLTMAGYGWRRRTKQAKPAA